MSVLTMTTGSVRAEWAKQSRRPATWILGAILCASIFLLGYAFVTLAIMLIERGAANPQNPNAAFTARLLRNSLLPANFVVQVVPLVSSIGGAIALILGALTLGSEYSWGTLKTILTQRPGRLNIFAGKVLTLALVILIFSAGALGIGLTSSLVFALLSGSAATLPAIATVGQGLGVSWLILAAWTALGVMLAALFRGTALAIGLGLVYALVLETVAGGVAMLVEQTRPIRQAFLGANTGALANAFSAPGPGQEVASGTRIGVIQAALVVSAYIAVFLAVAALSLRRRDVA